MAKPFSDFCRRLGSGRKESLKSIFMGNVIVAKTEEFSSPIPPPIKLATS